MSKGIKSEPYDSVRPSPMTANSSMASSNAEESTTPRSHVSSITSTKSDMDKRKITKSRNGCLTCKKKRLKCDETKPACLKCINKNIDCGGYATRFKWRSFNDDGDKLETPSGMDPNPNVGSLNKHLELASLSVTGKSVKDIKRDNYLISEGINPETYKKRFRDTSVNNAQLFANLGDSSLNMNEGEESSSKRKMQRSMSVNERPVNSWSQMNRSLSADSAMTNGDFMLPPGMSPNRPKSSLNSLAEAAVGEISRSPVDSRASIPSLSPISDYMHSSKSPDAKMNRDLAKFNQSFIGSHNSSYLVNLSPSLSALINSAFSNEDMKNSHLLDEALKLDIPLSPLNLQNGGFVDIHDSPAPSPGSIRYLDNHVNPHAITNSSMGTSAHNTPLYHASSPLNISAEQEQILGLYAQYTAEILSIKNGPNENPWRKLILPYALEYSCLFNSIASITLFHLSGNEAISLNKENLRAKGYMYMKRCILELASGLSAATDGKNETKQIPADIAIAICLNLAVSETWDKHVSTGIAHLKGAKTMIQNVLTMLKDNQAEMKSKRRKLFSSPSPSPQDTEEYGKLINTKRELLKKRLVLVEDSEWDDILVGEVETDRNDTKPGQFTIPKSTQFLFNIWIYFEVLAQMTTESDEKGVDLVASITTILQDSKLKESKHKNSDKLDISPDAKSESSDLTMANRDTFGGIHRGFNNLFDNFENMPLNTDLVDPLLGCAQSLFSIMGKVATLISKIRKSRKKDQKATVRNTLSTITAATQLRQELLSWKPTISASMIEQANSVNSDPANSDLSSCIATAEAYRFSTLLYLHQAVPEIPSLSSHQLAEKIFILLASIPTTSPTYTIHIFPLLVSSCEAEPKEEREWCEERWRLLSNRLWIGNVDSAFKVVQEVWKRKDDYIRKKNINSLNMDEVFIPQGNDTEKLKNISNQLSGLMAAVNSDQVSVDDITGGIYSKLHWSSIMKEWGWEVLLG